MNFEPKDYYRAALERMEQARSLFRRGLDLPVNMHPLAMGAAGVAVECLLRAFITRRNREFDGRHDLTRLYEQSGLWNLEPDVAKRRGLPEIQLTRYKREVDAAINTVHRLWQNNFRYADERRLRSHLHTIDSTWRGRGDILAEKLRDILNAAGKIIERGTVLWESDPTSPKT